MSYVEIVKQLSQALSIDMPFAIFNHASMPNESNKIYLKKSIDKDLVFGDGSKTEVTIKSFSTDSDYPSGFNIKESEKESHYIKIVEDAIRSIKTRRLDKVVLARTRSLPNTSLDSLSHLYSKLVVEFPDSLTFMFKTPSDEVWIGATPELLIAKNKSTFKTIALAGTKAQDSSWSKKEIKEQEIVTKYIIDKLSAAKVHNLLAEEPTTLTFGDIQHLCTRISFNGDRDIIDYIQAFYPSPAICGLPTNAAKTFITENEQFNREYYTGSITINTSDSRALSYAILRCGKFINGKMILYAGCGITQHSTPKKEWIESNRKIDTIARLM